MQQADFLHVRNRSRRVQRGKRSICPFVLAIGACVSLASPTRADEGGVSFWLPGSFGSLAATPQTPGWAGAVVYYHTSVKAGGDVAFARQVTLGRLTTNFTGNVNANLKAEADLGFFNASYVFASPFLGGQAAASLLLPVGRNKASVDATLIGAVGPLGFVTSGSRADEISGIGDLYPQFAVRWNAGVHNWMTYLQGDIPVGAYQAGRLANLGIGHGAIDGGGGYTYFNPETGREFSAVAGFTYNFENPDTNYKNGIAFHTDIGALQFLSKQLAIGAVGYAYQQLTGDSGSGARLGDFKSRVFGIGPQLSYIFPIGGAQGYLNLKGYKEFAAENRAEGWNVWLTLSISPAAAAPPPATRPIRK